MPYIIERTDTSPRSFLSLALGRNCGAPQGAFSKERADATVFATSEAVDLALAHLGPAAMVCAARKVEARAVVSKPLPPELGGFPSAIVSDISNKL